MTLISEILIAVALTLVGTALISYIISIYNGLVQLRNNINKAWANIDVLLKQRHDELPKLIETVRGYMQYESGLLNELVKVRESEEVAKTIHEKALASEAVSRGLVALFARAEAYPDLKANETYSHLQQRISGLENNLADRREFYNDSVNQLNIRIESFPDMYMAKLMDLQLHEMFRVSEEEKVDVEIKLFPPK